ncbi:MAG: Gfo/Idh/MocA family oxidoreductase [Oscillospiraceae bacterium]|nr:Gfo/Idh/MocA family oxidoreductase [Oscillospiraceae bacterium]
MKIGLIGAQNSHSKGFCDAINKKRPWEDVSVSFIYGADDPEQANKLCGEFGLTECESEEELIEKSDAVAITYRKGSMHCKAAIKALKAGKPLFVDKPFTANVEEAKEIAALAKSGGALLCGGSGCKHAPEIAEMKKDIKPGSTVVISYAADSGSEYDGYWFYGCHSAEVCLELCGPDYVSVQSFKNGDVVVTNVVYADKVCVIVTEPKAYNLTVSVSADGKTVCRPIPYYPDAPASELVKMAKSKIAPRDYGFYVKSVELTGKIIESYEKQQ